MMYIQWRVGINTILLKALETRWVIQMVIVINLLMFQMQKVDHGQKRWEKELFQEILDLMDYKICSNHL